MTKRIITILLIALGISHFSFAQKAHNYEYFKEILGGVNFNTNGGTIGGAMFKMTWHRNHSVYHSFGIEAGNVKHPKEIRVTSFTTGNTYIAWKQNYLFPVRFHYGRDFILFNRAPEEGVQINATLVGGPTIGILKPYFIQYGPTLEDAETVAFDPDKHTDFNQIYGSGSFLKGFDQSKVMPGINIKMSLTFYFTKFGKTVTGLETGFMVESYFEEVVLIPFVKNRQVFTSAFINIFFGSRKI